MSIHKAGSPTHLLLLRGETGLQEDSIVKAEDITTILKTALMEPRLGLGAISDRRICELAIMVRIAMGC